MSNLNSIIRYICLHYPYSGELSKARLTKIIYLADWLNAQKNAVQLTNISWVFNHYGPYVDDVMLAASSDPYLKVISTINFYGTPKVMVALSEENPPITLNATETKILDAVIEETAPLSFNDFIKHVYNTYPIRTADRYDILDIPKLAQAEKKACSD